MKKLLIITLTITLHCNINIFASLQGKPPLHPNTFAAQKAIYTKEAQYKIALCKNHSEQIDNARAMMASYFFQKEMSENKQKPLGMTRSKKSFNNLQHVCDDKQITNQNCFKPIKYQAATTFYDLEINSMKNFLQNDNDTSPVSVTTNQLSPR